MKYLATYILFSLILIFLLTGCCQKKLKNNCDINEDIDNIFTGEDKQTYMNEFGVVQSDFEMVNSHFRCGYKKPCTHPQHEQNIFWVISKQGCPIIDVKSWNEIKRLNYECSKQYSEYECCATLYSDKGGIFAISPKGLTKDMKVITFTKHSDNNLIQSIVFSVEIGLIELYCNFIDENSGYIFVVYEESISSPVAPSATDGILIYKTDDSGKSWNLIEQNEPLLLSSKDSVIYANFLDANIGTISGKLWTTDLLEDRTYITFDGGTTWEKISSLPYPSYECGHGSELIELDYSDGIYLMTVKIIIGSSDNKIEYHVYASTDMKLWKFQEKNT